MDRGYCSMKKACPSCGSQNTIKKGKSRSNIQKYICKNCGLYFPRLARVTNTRYTVYSAKKPSKCPSPVVLCLDCPFGDCEFDR